LFRRVAALVDANCNLADKNSRQPVQKFLDTFAAWLSRFKDERGALTKAAIPALTVNNLIR
jgi:hypothetical protein